MMELEDDNNKMASNLMQQFLDAGLIEQMDDGSFMMPESQSK